MSKRTLKWLTAVLSRLLYFLIACVLVVASVLTLERGLPPALRSRLGSSSQAANLHQTEDGTWTTYTFENTSQPGDQVTTVTMDTPIGSELVPVGFASEEETNAALPLGYVMFGDDLTVYRYWSYSDNYDLGYAYQDASGWHIETVETIAGWVGKHSSLALDRDGYPHISYYDSTNGDLKYAYQDASGWHIETVDSEEHTGQHTSLVLDGGRYPHISYYGNGNLKYAYLDASAWHVETVDSERNVGPYTSLALDGGGYPHISYWDVDDDDLKYAYQDTSGWHIKTVDSEGHVGPYTSLALDESGYPHISYFDLSNGDLKYAYQDQDASGWHVEAVDSEGSVGYSTSLALGDGRYPHISYYAGYPNNDLKYAYQDASGWHVETVDEEEDVGGFTSLALDEGGYPHISYYYCGTSFPPPCDVGDLKYTYQDASVWHFETVDTVGAHGGHISLALDEGGYPHISYRSLYGSGSLLIDSPLRQGVSAGTPVYAVELGLASDDILSMAMNQEGNTWFGTTSGASKFDGENWTTYDTSNSGLVSDVTYAIVTDNEGNVWFGTCPGVSEFDGSNWTTYLANECISAIAIDQEGEQWFGTRRHGVSKFDGITWTTYNTSNSGLTSNRISAMAIDREGNRWFGTEYSGVSKFDGQNWTTYNTSNSGLASNYLQSIAIDSANVKWLGGCIGYAWSPGFFGCDAAAVSRFDGVNWISYIAGESNLVGRKVNAIAIDWWGNKWFGTDAGVSKFDGVNWTTYDTSNSGLASDDIRAIATDNEGNIWFGTYGGGVSKYSLPILPLMPKIFLPYIGKTGVP